MVPVALPWITGAANLGVFEFTLKVPVCHSEARSAIGLVRLGDTPSLAIFTVIGALLFALLALFQAVRFRRRLSALEDSYYQKDYIRELAKSQELVGALKGHFVPYDAGRGASGGKRSAAEFGEIVRLHAKLSDLEERAELALAAKAALLAPAGVAQIDIHRQASEPLALQSAERGAESTAAAMLPVPVSSNDPSAGKDLRSAERIEGPIVGKESAQLNAPPHTNYYAPMPEKEGTFMNLTERQDWDSLYWLGLDGDPSTATSAFVDVCENPEKFKTAIAAPRWYLNPVCDYVGDLPASASVIKVVRRGRAERDSVAGRWRIREKLQVEFR
jgi:hypothetical protein